MSQSYGLLKEHARPPDGFVFVESNRTTPPGVKVSGNLVHLRVATKVGLAHATCGVYGVHQCRPREGDRLCPRCRRAADDAARVVAEIEAMT